MSQPIAIYAGYTVRYPLGGRLAAELQNIAGLQRLGYDVVFVEESGSSWEPCYDPVRNVMTRDAGHGLRVLQEALRPLGLADRWCYVDSERQYHGLPAAELRALCRQATLLFSLAGTTWLEEFAECRTRVFVDSDPGFTQFAMAAATKPLRSCSGYANPFDYQRHFTYGPRIGRPDCPIPTLGLTWEPTRPPVVLDQFPYRFTPAAKCFTTVMSWSSRKPIVYQGEEYGQKNVEFMRIINLPRRVGPVFEVAVAAAKAPLDQFRAAGWRLVDPLQVTATVGSYRDYIEQSRGEFSVAVNLCVKSRNGWFSERTAKYLAAGKPAIVQDTGFPEFLPCGEGLFAFQTEDDAVAAVEKINADYERHCRAARRIAEEYFDSDKVLGDLLRRCDLPVGK